VFYDSQHRLHKRLNTMWISVVEMFYSISSLLVVNATHGKVTKLT